MSTPKLPRYRDFKVPTVVDETLREGLERCMFTVGTDDLYRLLRAQYDAGIRDTIVGAGPVHTALLERICAAQDAGELAGGVCPIFIVLLNCWDATYERFKRLPRDWVERTTVSFGMVEHRREERLFERVFDKFATLGVKRFKSSVLNDFSCGFGDEQIERIRTQIDWGARLGIRAFRINDSLGKLYPEDAAELCRRLVTDFPEMSFCLHCHNDHGLALANQLTSLYYGFQAVEGALCGFGNRAGLTPLENLASVCADKNIQLGDTPVDLQKLRRNALLAEEIYMAVPNTHRPVSGCFVSKANFGVLNIPDFLQAGGDRDYFLNLANLHPETVVRALTAHGLSGDEIDSPWVERTLSALADLIQDRHASARDRYSASVRNLLQLYTTLQLSTADIVSAAMSQRQIRRRP
jgi:2-isopropylmalate synthase